MKKKILASALAAVMLLSAGVCTASAGTTIEYSRSKAEYTADSKQLKIDMFGIGEYKHMGVTSRSTYFANSGDYKWSSRHTYSYNEQGPYRPRQWVTALKRSGSNGVMCGGIGTNYNSQNFVFKYN